jgi:hypothetical protein
MAKSKLIVRRKKATVRVSTQTLQEAIRRANLAVESLMESNPNDPRINKIEGAVQHMGRILNANPQQMKQDGASSISDYMDDAKMPAEATKLKQEVDMINQLHSEVRGQHSQPAEPQGQEVGYVPDSAVQGLSASAKQADAGAAGFVTDRDEKGEAKAPERLEVPRLAKKKKEAVPEEPVAAAPAPVPAAAPAAPAASGSVNAIDYIPTEALIKVIEDLPKEDDFAQNQGKQDALIELTNVLKSRPVLPPEPAEGAAAPAAPAPASTAPALAGGGAEAPAVPAPVSASAKKADLGDHAMSGKNETIGNGSGASAAVGHGGVTQVSPDAGRSKSPAPEKAPLDLGGLSVASALEEEKTAEDYRLQDYKITQEGIRPQGGLPTMDEQEAGGHHSVNLPEQQEVPMHASVQAAIKQGKTPPGISEELMHKLKKQYPGEKDKAYATAWKIHNEKESALKVIAAEIEKLATSANSGGWYTSYKPMEVDEDGGRTPEIGEAHSKLEDNTGISHPDTTMPIKLNEQQSLKASAKNAADKSTSKAVKEAEQIGNDLKKMYLDAKSLTAVNDTRPVREAVEAIFRAADMFDEATKTLNKQDQQEKSEAEAAEIKAKNKKSAFEGLALAASAE